MTILDRYILWHFFRNFVLWLFCLAGVVVLIDIFTKVESLIAAGNAAGSVWTTFVSFCFFRMLPMGLSMAALIALASAMMTLAMMMRSNEIVPIQAAGISDLRIVLPLFGAVLVVAFGGVVFREAFLPSYLDRLTDNPNTFVGLGGLAMMSKVDNETGVTLQGDRIFTRSHRIESPSFTLRAPLVRRAVLLKGSEAIYEPKTAEHPAGFLMRGVTNLRETVPQSISLGDRTVVFTPQEHKWLNADECFVATRVPFMYLAVSDTWRVYASTWEMMSAVRNPSLEIGTSQYSTIHGRIVQPFLDLSLIFLGLPLLFSRSDRNVFKTIGLSALLVVGVLAMRETSLFLGTNSGAPVLGAWFPLMLLVPLSVRSFYGLLE
ncbi:MAG: LptF/LptG family permease [Thermoguttaceae bacterium]